MSPYFSSHCLGVNLGGRFFVKDGDCFAHEDSGPSASHTRGASCSAFVRRRSSSEALFFARSPARGVGFNFF